MASLLDIPMLCCASVPIPSFHSNPHILLFLAALQNARSHNAIFASSPPSSAAGSADIPTSPAEILEFEVITLAYPMIRMFGHSYFVLSVNSRNDSPAYREMYPEESFVAIDPGYVDVWWMEEWRWWRKEESLGEDMRVGWKCSDCGVEYWVRVFEDKTTT